ncbi:MAG: GNAT family N-acetyltransferase [Actinomycetota bacterium]
MTDFALATDRATPGLDRGAVGAWILRHALGETGRANSMTAHGDPGLPIAEAIDRAEAWYADRRRPAIVQLFDETPAPVGDELDRRGYETGAITDVLAAPVAAVRGRIVVRDGLSTVVDLDLPPFLGDQLSPARAREMQSTALATRYATATIGGAVVGGGMAIVDGDLVGVFAMRTDPQRQGLGAGTAVLAALLDSAIADGVTTAWLQVEAANERAASWYERLGFERRTGYRYRHQFV